MPVQTFRPALKKLVGPALMPLTFFAWAFVAFVVVPRESVRSIASGFGLALVGGLPLVMGLLSAVYLLGLLARTTIDDEALTIAGPLGRRAMRWADVVGHDIVGTAKEGVTLYARDGRRLGVPFLAYEGDGLRRAINARLRRLPPPSVEGREFPIEGRWGTSILLVGILLFFAVAIASTSTPAKGQAWALLVLLALVLLPFVPYQLTDRMALRDGVLTKRSLYGTKRLALADVTKAELRVVNGKGGAREFLILRGPTTLHLSAQREGYAMLRDAVIAELRPGIRPKPLT